MLRLLAGVSFFVFCSLAFLYFDYISAGPLSHDSNVVLPRGKGFQASVDALADAGVIAHPLLFKIVTFATGDARHIKAGEYHFSAGISAYDVVEMLLAGKVVIHKLTVAEGLNVREVVALLVAEPVLEGALPVDMPKEGSLLPETYYFTYGDTRAALLVRMQEGARKVLAELWEKRDVTVPFETPEQALIMASIVEKETGLAQERPHVASVFINRLKRGMKLQSDPTTVYGIEQQTARSLGRELTLNDLQAPTPYNTYTIDGLPPTPITNPGKAAIMAVLHPDATDDLYFVATGSGGHYFASTLDGHNRNVAAYHAALRHK